VIVVLRAFDDLSNPDVAAALGITPTTASHRYHRALMRLRKLLGG
jgi:DNA-directed RNA polymerase specialized sigma24 family protein